MNGVALPFDADRHRREKLQRAERRAAFLATERARLERLLALALRVATHDGKDADPLALLSVIEELDRAVQSCGSSVDESVVLLRETA